MTWATKPSSREKSADETGGLQLAPLQPRKQAGCDYNQTLQTKQNATQPGCFAAWYSFAFYFYAESICAVRILVPSTVCIYQKKEKKKKDIKKSKYLINHITMDRVFFCSNTCFMYCYITQCVIVTIVLGLVNVKVKWLRSKIK